MIDGINEFLGILKAARLHPTVEEIRDTLWLSVHVLVPELSTPTPGAVPAVGAAVPSSTPPAGTSELVSNEPATHTELYAAGTDPVRPVRGIPARSPAVPALRQQAALLRALRPLKRTKQSTTTLVVDEEATANQIATDGLWLPVLRPGLEKWLDLILVIDTAASMIVWQRTLAEFRRLTEQLGAFRRISVVEIDCDQTETPTAAPTVSTVRPATDPATLIDPTQRQVILVLTDGVGRAWQEGWIQPHLRQWGRRGSVAVVTVLPQRMWAGSGLRAKAGRVWVDRPGLPNSKWRGYIDSDVPIPVLEMSSRWLRPWAQLVSESARRHHAAMLGDHAVAATSERRQPAAPSALEIVDTFRAAASPTGFRLACFLSAAWLNLPVMRLVQQLMLPDSDVSHLAEVFLGGLLHRIGRVDADIDPDRAQYEFAPGVREELNNYLLRSDLLTVLRLSSEFVAEQFGQSFDFAALLADPDGAELPAVAADTGGRPLAVVSAEVLSRLGGRYKTLAERLAARSTHVAAASVTDENPDPAGEKYQIAPTASPDVEYADLIAAARRDDGTIDHDALTQLLIQFAADAHWRTVDPGPVVEFDDGPATFLFAQAGASHADRTLVAVAHPEPPRDARDVAYQRGYPLPGMVGGRPVDRGHFIPYTGGGQYGPNLFVQDRALNRGWSRDGRDYRALERAAVAGAPDTLMFARPRYVDDTDVPGFVDLGVATATEIVVQRFKNRFDIDEVAGAPLQLELMLPGATNAQIGALGEETALVLLTENLGATIVAMDDVELARGGTRPDVDLLAIFDGELIAYEVKASYASAKAGRLTRSGNLPRPRLQRSRSFKEGDPGEFYVADRSRSHLDVNENILFEIIAIDFVAMLAQWFRFDDAGTGLRPTGPPIDCTAAARKALDQIVERRGHT
jgi:hypothetical protein